MVSVNIALNLYELKNRIRKEIARRIGNLEVNSYPLDFAWLLYALSLNSEESNLLFNQYINLLEKWAVSEESGRRNRDMAPLSICGFLSTDLEIRHKITEKVRKIVNENIAKTDIKFNVLNDPEQVFCLSLLLKEDNIISKLVDVIKKNLNGKTSRKVLFIAALIELGEDPKNFLKDLYSFRTAEDTISVLWFYERYRDILNENVVRIWKSFDNIYPNIEIEFTEERSAISNRNLALLYEAVIRELTEPDPKMLFDLYPFNEEIKKIAVEHFKTEKYVSAVFEATKKLNEFIQNVTGISNKNEVELVQATMKQIGNPEKLIIKFNDFLSEDSGKNEQKGLALITDGIFSAFRNPKGHKPEDHPLVDIDPYEALAQLIIIDYIWKRIESAKINKRGD